MTHSYLLSLADLQAAALGVLDVVFGSDGDFEGAPPWRCPIWGRRTREPSSEPEWLSMSGFADGFVHYLEIGQYHDEEGRSHQHGEWDIIDATLDLRVPSIAARLAWLCCRAADPARMLDSWQRAADLAARAAWGEWNPEYAPALASLFLSLAPRIAALRKP